MVPVAHLGYTVAQTVLLVFAVRLLLRERHWILVAFVINTLGLVYDNLMLGIGHLIGPGDLLMALNYPRYLIHATTTPLFGLIGLYLARNTGARWAWSRSTTVIFWLITLPALAWAIYVDLIMLTMEPVASMGTLRYANAAASGAPLGAVVSMLLLIFCGIGIIVHRRWPWLFLGSIIMFSMAAVAATIGVIANLGEIAQVACIIATASRFPQLSFEEFQRRQRVLSSAEGMSSAD